MNGRAGDWRQTAISPMTVSRATSGAASSRSSTSFTVPGIGTARGSAQTLFTISGSRLAADPPMIPSPSWMTSAVISSAIPPRATIARNDRPSGSAR